MATSTFQSLYQRLGHGAIVSAIDALYDRLLNHHQTWYYWKGCSVENRKFEQRQFADLVFALAGGPLSEPAGPGESALKGLVIGSVPVGTFAGLVAETLLQSLLPYREQDELFCVLTHSKSRITGFQQAPSPTAAFAGYAPGLTEREKEVLCLLALGKSNSEIARALCISINTVTRHLTNIFLKTDTRNRVEAAVYAVRHNLL